MIKEVFQEAGLPEDMAYLAMIESGFNNKAYSPAAASGMWQFIKGTGLRYGLAIDSYVDERRDPEKATRAAANYLLDLYKQFGSWYLAAASYNCGEGRVQRELNQSSHKNFWELSANMCLPTETKNYVPQMITATIIAKNPEKFGFSTSAYLPPVKYDKVAVTETTSLTAASVAVNVPTEEVQALNPELLRGVTSPGYAIYTLNLPSNSKELYTKTLPSPTSNPAVASHPSGPPEAPGSPIPAARAPPAARPAWRTSPTTRADTLPEPPRRPHLKPIPNMRNRPKTPRKPGAAPVVQASLIGTPSKPPNPAMPRKTRWPSASQSKTKGEAAKSKNRATPG